MHLTNLREVMCCYFEAKGADSFDKLAELILFERFTQSLRAGCSMRRLTPGLVNQS